MRKNILLKTNLFVCTIIVIGFAITSIISYHSNLGIFEVDVERVSNLTLEGISHQLDSIFTKPINISLTMANDSLLKTFLSEEEQLDDEAFIEDMRNYLLAYKEKYAYDSVFLVSTATNRYYHFNGLDRVLTPDDPENKWYYAFLESSKECLLNIDNDEAAQANNEITVFVNCKIVGPDGATKGVVGVGFQVDDMQDLLKQYEKKFDVQAYLVDRNGTIEISTAQTGYEEVNLFENCAYPELKNKILSNQKNTQSFWYASSAAKGYLVTKYEPNLEWYLVVDNNTSLLKQKLSQQFFGAVLVVILIIAFVIFTITSIIRRFNREIVELTVAKEQEHRTMFQQATEQMYENIYEIDITHNRAASEATEAYFKSLGVPGNTPYDQALQIIAQKQIKEEFQQGYIDTFTPANVLKAYQDKIESLRYDFMLTENGHTYHWMRITARIFYWADDESIRMFVYRQNIELEKQREKQMLEQIHKDPLSGLYNKAATQNQIQQLLSQNPQKLYAFFILDIDDFKQVNDTYGHATGDFVLAEFAKILKAQFRDYDIVGRIGGDEFIVFLPVPSQSWVQEKAQSLVLALHREFIHDTKRCRVSSSIGIAMGPEAGTDFETLYKNADFALYQTKKRGKNGFTMYQKS